MNEDVEKALEVMDARWGGYGNAKAIIRQALRDQDAEIEMLRAPFSDEDITAGAHWFGQWVAEKRRHEKAEELLRAAMPLLHPHSAECARIALHLGVPHDQA